MNQNPEDKNSLPLSPGSEQQPISTNSVDNAGPMSNLPNITLPGSVISNTATISSSPPTVTDKQLPAIHNTTSNGRPRSKIMMIVTVVITVIAIGLSAYGAVHVYRVRKDKRAFATSANKQRQDQIQQAVEKSKPEVADRNDGKLDVSQQFDSDFAQRQQDIQGALNQQLNMADGLSFMVTKVEGDWKRAGAYNRLPPEGKAYIKVSVVIGNRAEKSLRSFYLEKLQLANSKGVLQNIVSTSEEDLPNNGLGGSGGVSLSLRPGAQQSGFIVFEVGKGESPISLVYEQKGYGCRPNDNKDCLMKGAIKLLTA